MLNLSFRISRKLWKKVLYKVLSHILLTSMKKTNAIIILSLIAIFFISSCSNTTTANIGEKVILSYNDKIPIFKSYSAFKESGDAAVVGLEEYEYTHKEHIRSGKKFYVESGIEAIILDVKVFEEAYEIRILSGSYEGEKGWTQQVYVKSGYN